MNWRVSQPKAVKGPETATSLKDLEPVIGLEPMTCALRVRRTATRTSRRTSLPSQQNYAHMLPGGEERAAAAANQLLTKLRHWQGGRDGEPMREEPLQVRGKSGSAGRIRTYNPPVNSRTLYH